MDLDFKAFGLDWTLVIWNWIRLDVEFFALDFNKTSLFGFRFQYITTSISTAQGLMDDRVEACSPLASLTIIFS